MDTLRATVKIKALKDAISLLRCSAQVCAEEEKKAADLQKKRLWKRRGREARRAVAVLTQMRRDLGE